MPQGHKALFLDRDGVINHEVGYLHHSADVVFVEGIFPLVRLAQSQGYKTVVVTNQSGIARGLYTETQFHTLMDWMQSEFLRENASLDAVYFCPFHPTQGQGHYAVESPDRKPSPGMLLRAAQDLDLNLSQSILIGDRCTDVQAAKAAGLRQSFLIAGTEPTPCTVPHIPITRLAEAELWLATHP